MHGCCEVRTGRRASWLVAHAVRTVCRGGASREGVADGGFPSLQPLCSPGTPSCARMGNDFEYVHAAPVVAVEEPGRSTLYLSIVQPIEIGRECSGVLLSDLSISRRHLLVARHCDSVTVTDQATTNGTSLGGEPLPGHHVLRAGERVAFGSCTLVLVAPGPCHGPEGELGATVGDQATTAEQAHLRATSIDRVAYAALAERHVPRADVDAGTMTIVFSDIEDSTTRAVELGDTAWGRVIAAYNAIVRRMLERHGGVELKAQGDGFMLRFRSVRSAVACTIGVQRALREFGGAEPLLSVRVRAGIHTGEVIVGDDGDIYGRHVIMAARVAAVASGGEILMSGLAHDIVAARGEVRFGAGRVVELKGLAGRHHVHPVEW